MEYIDVKSSQHFDDIVARSPAIARFHSTTCGHCLAMEPAWEKLRGHPALKRCRQPLVDVESRFIPGIASPSAASLRGFPTIMHVHPGGLPGQEYVGDRSVQSMVDFILSQQPDPPRHTRSRRVRSRHTRPRHTRSRHTRPRHTRPRHTRSKHTRSKHARSRRSGPRHTRSRRT